MRPTDKTICRYCKLTEPTVKIVYSKGLPRGVCTACRNSHGAINRKQKLVFKGFYTDTNALVSLNLKTLLNAAPGAYPLTFARDQTRQGYIALRAGIMFINLYGQSHNFRYDLFGASTWLSNQNLVVGARPMPLETPEGAPIALDTVGSGMPIEDITALLVMYDAKLKDWAIKQVKAELGLVKERFKPTARMGQRAKPGPKPKAK